MAFGVQEIGAWAAGEMFAMWGGSGQAKLACVLGRYVLVRDFSGSFTSRIGARDQVHVPDEDFDFEQEECPRKS